MGMDPSRKAVDVLKEMMEEEETLGTIGPSTYCLYAECTLDTSYYDKAWEVSGHKIARAKRGKGLYLVRAMHYHETIEDLETSLAIHAIMPGVWFTYGYACMQIREWEKAFRTFSRVVQLQSDDGEAWNNVGSLYIELGQMDQAYVALQEAVKYRRESWRIWENLLTVSLHHGDVYNAVLCVETILELQPQQLDEKAVEHLTTAAIDALRSD